MTRSFAPPSAARSPWTWALLGALLGALLALALFAPAQWLARSITQASAGQVQLAQARGTLWNGSAQLVLTGGGASQDRAALPGRIVWQLRPTWSGLRAQLHAACCTDSALQLQVKLRWGGAQLTLADSQSQWPGHAVEHAAAARPAAIAHHPSTSRLGRWPHGAERTSATGRAGHVLAPIDRSADGQLPL